MLNVLCPSPNLVKQLDRHSVFQRDFLSQVYVAYLCVMDYFRQIERHKNSALSLYLISYLRYIECCQLLRPLPLTKKWLLFILMCVCMCSVCMCVWCTCVRVEEAWGWQWMSSSVSLHLLRQSYQVCLVLPAQLPRVSLVSDSRAGIAAGSHMCPASVWIWNLLAHSLTAMPLSTLPTCLPTGVSTHGCRGSNRHSSPHPFIWASKFQACGISWS